MALTPLERLRKAGLDPDLPAVPIEDGTGREADRYCPYTGRELIMERDGQRVRVGQEAFASAGGLVRYTASGAAELVESATELGRHRGQLDLWLSTGTPLPEGALRRERVAGAAAAEVSLIDAGRSEVKAAACRHGRLYWLSAFGSRNLALQAMTLPEAQTPAGWQHQGRIGGTVVPAPPGQPGTELRVSESLVYLNLAEGLRAWHAGTGQMLVDWRWPSHQGLPLVRILDDRLLLARPVADGLSVGVYDLAAVAGGQSQPLEGQTLLLPNPPQGPEQTRWAGTAGDRFVVMGPGGQIAVFPLDADPFLAYDNLAGLTLGEPGLRTTPEGPELLVWATAPGSCELVTALLLKGARPRTEPCEHTGLDSYQLAPCFFAGGLLEIGRSEAGLNIGRSAPPRLTVPLERVPLPESSGTTVKALRVVVLAGEEYLVVERQHGTRRLWLADRHLAPVDLGSPLPPVKGSDTSRLFWDAAGLYLCNLTTGILHIGRLP